MEITYVPNPQAADGRPVASFTAPAYVAAGGLTAHVTLQESVGPYAPVTVTGFLANSGNMSTFGKLLGLTATGGQTGDTILVYAQGEITAPGWAWQPGSILYLSGTQLSAQIPSVGYVQQVGVARDATTVEVHPMPPIQI